MNRLQKFAAAFAGVAVLSFLGGFLEEHSKVTDAEAASARCQSGLDGLSKVTSREQGLLDLYRARLELMRANYGTAGDFLAKAKTALNADPAAGASIDKAAEAVKKQDTGAGDLVQQVIAAREAPH